MVTPSGEGLQQVFKSTPTGHSQRAASRFWFDPHDASTFNSVAAASASLNSFEFLQTNTADE
jgi:hypothetical protein